VKRYVLALDQGTTSSRAILFDERATQVAVAQEEFTQHFPQPGWVEHDPEEIWESQRRVAEQALADVDPAEVAAIGITNQRETTLVWDRASGEPIHRAIVWQDRRTASRIERLKREHGEEFFQRRSGLVPDAYFAASKVAWILEHVDGARERAERGELAFGTVDSWLVHRLSGGALHLTDASNASRTLLFDIHRLDWSDELFEAFGIPRSMAPEVRSSSEIYGEVAIDGPLRGLPVAGIAGDQHAALFGQLCHRPGMLKNTYGTGCFLLAQTGTTPKPSHHRLLTTIAWQREGETHYALEGSIFIGGAVVQWLRDGLGLIEESSEIRELAGSVPDSDGVVMVPAFAGLGAPHWDSFARGTVFGLTRGTTAAHLARAAVESMAFQSADLLDAILADLDGEGEELRVDGGATVDDALLQFQADILQRPVVRPKMIETTALGAAYLAGLAGGLWPDVDALRENWQVDRRFEPAMSAAEAGERRARWNEAVKRSLGWLEEDDS